MRSNASFVAFCLVMKLIIAFETTLTGGGLALIWTIIV